MVRTKNNLADADLLAWSEARPRFVADMHDTSGSCVEPRQNSAVAVTTGYSKCTFRLLLASSAFCGVKGNCAYLGIGIIKS